MNRPYKQIAQEVETLRTENKALKDENDVLRCELQQMHWLIRLYWEAVEKLKCEANHESSIKCDQTAV